MTERELLTRLDAELANAISALPVFVPKANLTKGRAEMATLLAGILDRLEALEARQ